jgi:hypothetical protein
VDIDSIGTSKVKTVEDINLDSIFEMLKVNVLYQLKKIVRKYMNMEKKVKMKDFVNSISALEVVKATDNHVRLFQFTFFKDKVTDGSIKC